MVLHRGGFTTRRHSDGKVTNYMYFEVESVVEQKPLKEGTFAFDLNFYAKKYKAKAKILKFTC